MDNKVIQEAAQKIAEQQKTGFRKVELTELEAMYITCKILRIPARITYTLRKELGTRVLQKIWGGDIKGECKTVKW